MQSTREVASGVVNIGSTCYMNAVLQAMAHSPELCSAIECESHYKDCRPIALKKMRQLNTQNEHTGTDNPGEICEEKSTTRQEQEQQHGSKRRKMSNDARNGNGKDNDNPEEFCLLCEFEKHIMRVHKSESFLEDSMAMTTTGNFSLSSNNNNSNNSNSSSNNEAVAPSTFVHGFINHVAPWFRLGVQEDSHEFLRLLIDAMQKSCIRRRKLNMDQTTISSGSTNSNNDLKTKGDESNKSTTASTQEDGDEYSFRLFRGKVESIVTCSNCKSNSSTTDPIEDIGLEVMASSPRGGGKTSPTPSSLSDVTQSLEKFIATEKLDSGYTCESCGRVGYATKQSRLASIPPILTLHLKRFRYGNDGGKHSAPPLTTSRRRNNELASLLGNGDGSSGSAKIEGHVKFLEIFDIRPYLTKEGQNKVGRSMLCRLFAVIVHAGKNSHSGHYICYVRNVAKNEWWKMDDAKVTRVSTGEVFAAQAYMLFYRVVDHPVSVDLRNKEKLMKEDLARQQAVSKAAAAAAKVQQQESKEMGTQESDDTITTIGDTSSCNKRKRKEPDYKSGDDWARTVTNLPLTWMPFLRRIQDVLSDQFNFKSEYFRVLQDEVKSGGKLGAGPSVGIAADDIQGGLDALRTSLREMLKTVLPEEKDLLHQVLTSVKLEDSKNEASKHLETTPSNMNNESSSSTKKKSLIIPVFDTNDTML